MFRTFSAICLVMAMMFGAAAANAMVVVDPLVGDPNAMGGEWQGSKVFTYTGNLLDVVVDYAVYAPGKFAMSYPSADPSNGTMYIYAYQVYNTIDSSSSYVNRLSVGLSGGNEQASDLGFVAGSGMVPNNIGTNPALGFDTATAGWNFKDPTIQFGQASGVLFYASPYVPEWDSATVGGQYRKSLTLPSPLPEPATLAVLGIGMLVAGARRRRSA